jgi:hypothetical protein
VCVGLLCCSAADTVGDLGYAQELGNYGEYKDTLVATSRVCLLCVAVLQTRWATWAMRRSWASMESTQAHW